jgi:trk system potassium uptake protein TrkA
MAKRKRFLVVGLGALGRPLALALVREGAEVIALDNSADHIDSVKDQVDLAVEGDGSDIRTLEQIGVSTLDGAVVCIGEDLAAAVITTANLIDLKVPHVAARSNSPTAASILKRIGAHEIFAVESVVADYMARKLNETSEFREMELGSGYKIVQWEVTAKMVGKALAELALPKTYGIQVMAVRNKTSMELRFVTGETILEQQDLLLIVGSEQSLVHFLSKYSRS